MAPGRSEAHVFDEFDEWLNQKLELLRPVYMFAEDTFMPRSSMVAKRLYGLRAETIRICHRRNVRLRWVPVSTVHRFFTGIGRSPAGQKKQATIRVCRNYGWSPQSDNMADALAVWLFAEHAIAPNISGQRSMGTLWARAG